MLGFLFIFLEFSWDMLAEKLPRLIYVYYYFYVYLFLFYFVRFISVIYLFKSFK